MSTTSNAQQPAATKRAIVALCEGRGQAKGEVGIAAIDLSWPVLHCQQLSDSFSYVNTFTALEYFDPTEVFFKSH